MDTIRKPFQGVLNIIRFNWHFYILAIVVIIAALATAVYVPPVLCVWLIIIALLVFTTTLVSLSVSWYVYDASGFYNLNWLPGDNEKTNIVNINAGFDETSALLQLKYPNATLTVLDFYDGEKHTEVSIKRARKAYPAFPGTLGTTTAQIDLPAGSADTILLTFAAHEIRDDAERIFFFKQLAILLQPYGQVIVTEHLRDGANFFAYNIGCFHFLSKQSWYKTFTSAGFQIKKEKKITPFITTFTLTKYGTAN